MPRTPIYPEVEHLIFLKKRAKLEKINSESKKDNSTTQNPKRTFLTKRRGITLQEAPTTKNYNLKLAELLQIKLGINLSKIYSLSIPFATFCKNTPKQSQFFGKVIRGSSDDVGPILQDYKDTKREISAEQNLDMVQLTSSFVELSATLNGSLFVPENRLKNYGQFLPTACETIATTYNNYYVENFENIIWQSIRMRRLAVSRTWHMIKCLHIPSHPLYLMIFLPFFDPDVANNLPSFLNPLISEVNNCLSKLPVSKESLNNEPFKILSALRAYP
ncbi:uncharacterized protein BX663DRAFT_568118 [Cokeromyces recurvatus]|uniref:uncharacterized protein n=1 Tax=Cokeromyces recurvatus TaxID=90255 RepID=UPI00221E65F5|nr:uncharacterized protein BX663DRAFT_568118 [Cokeromyces recurvatus]KAI7903138.1 hypothetical protein BX663DRAFT_568118 [Cokeromyces recurvatus]